MMAIIDKNALVQHVAANQGIYFLRPAGKAALNDRDDPGRHVNFTAIHDETQGNVKLVAQMRRSAGRRRMNGNAPSWRQTKFLNNVRVNGRAARASV